MNHVFDLIITQIFRIRLYSEKQPNLNKGKMVITGSTSPFEDIVSF